jgi:hypothetical protein
MSHAEAHCPMCNRGLAGAQRVVVCGNCHGQLQATGVIAVHTTAEFPAVSQLADLPDDSAGNAPERPRRPTKPGDHECSWCGKRGDTVKKLLAKGAAKICNECVALCADIMQAELGDDWR